MDNYQQACGYAPVSIIEFMIIFSYTDNQGNLLGNRESGYEPWGSSILGAWFSSWYIVSIGTGHIAQSPQSAQDGVLLSGWSLFCLFPPSRQEHTFWPSNRSSFLQQKNFSVVLVVSLVGQTCCSNISSYDLLEPWGCSNIPSRGDAHAHGITLRLHPK